MEKERIDLEGIAGGAGEEKKYYCIEGYSKAYGGNVKLYVSTYNDAAFSRFHRKAVNNSGLCIGVSI